MYGEIEVGQLHWALPWNYIGSSPESCSDLKSLSNNLHKTAYCPNEEIPTSYTYTFTSMRAWCNLIQGAIELKIPGAKDLDLKSSGGALKKAFEEGEDAEKSFRKELIEKWKNVYYGKELKKLDPIETFSCDSNHFKSGGVLELPRENID